MLKPRPSFWCYTFRTEFDNVRNIPEWEIMAGHDGVSDFGVDFFPFKSPSGKMTHVGCGAGTGGPTCSTMALLEPGPDGPRASENFEAFREGVELGETILFLERSLQDKKISGELADRVNRLLDQRGEVFIKRWPNGRFERDLALLKLAGEVAAATSGK